MPRRDDISSIAIIGSGPIVIGQACEFDYSGVQALKVLREEGYRTVEGLRLLDVDGATVQYHPEAGPGPNDAQYVFDRFVGEIGASRGTATLNNAP